MRLKQPLRAAGALAALALALPATAAAVPTVYGVTAKTGDAGVTFLTDPTGASLTSTQEQYVVSVDGYAVGYREDNGVTRGGVVNYAALPSDYRAPMTAADKLGYAPAQTDVQAHATCSGVAALADPANVAAWQGRDPSYDYVPWQKASAGLGDDPTKWIAVVRAATGADLSALSSASDFTRACVALGGTYHAADTATAVDGALIANATAPLQRQITTLTAARATSDRAAATARAAQAAAEAAYQSFFQRPIRLTLAAKRFAPAAGVVMITGSPTDPVHVTLDVTRRQKRSLRLSDTELAAVDGELNDDGAALLAIKPDKGVVDKLERRKGTIAVTVLAVSGGSRASSKAKLTVQGLTAPKPKAKAKKGKRH